MKLLTIQITHILLSMICLSKMSYASSWTDLINRYDLVPLYQWQDQDPTRSHQIPYENCQLIPNDHIRERHALIVSTARTQHGFLFCYTRIEKVATIIPISYKIRSIGLNVAPRSFEYKTSEFKPLDQQSLHTIFGSYKGVSISGGILFKTGIAHLSHKQATLKLNRRGFAIFDLDLSYIQITLSDRAPSAEELLTPNFRHYVEEKMPRYHRLAAAAKTNLYTDLPLTLNVAVGPTTVTIKKYTDFAHYLLHASENMHYPSLTTPSQDTRTTGLSSIQGQAQHPRSQ